MRTAALLKKNEQLINAKYFSERAYSDGERSCKFSACFDNNEEDVEYILRIILEKSNPKVLKVQTQKIVENMYGRSVRFDVFETEVTSKLYNIEVKREDAGAVPTRARYGIDLSRHKRFDLLIVHLLSSLHLAALDDP